MHRPTANTGVASGPEAAPFGVRSESYRAMPTTPNWAAEIPGFAFRVGDSSHEVQAIALFCNEHRISRRFFPSPDEVPDGWIPVGNVSWCSAVLGRKIVPNYYPAFLSAHLRRHVWQDERWPIGLKVFIKPADVYKRFNGLLTNGTQKHKRRGPYWCSDVVRFRDEWRYYVIKSQVVAARWYTGPVDSPQAAPEISVEWPIGWCGTVDFGRLDDGSLALVEAHHPFAVGWYGTLAESAIFAEWTVSGWSWMQSFP